MSKVNQLLKVRNSRSKIKRERSSHCNHTIKIDIEKDALEGELKEVSKAVMVKGELLIKQGLLRVLKELKRRIKVSGLPISIKVNKEYPDRFVLVSFIKEYDKYFIAKTGVKARGHSANATSRTVFGLHAYSGPHYKHRTRVLVKQINLRNIKKEVEITDRNVMDTATKILNIHEEVSIELAYKDIEKYRKFGNHIYKLKAISDGIQNSLVRLRQRMFLGKNKMMYLWWSTNHRIKIIEKLSCNLKPLSTEQTIELINLVNDYYMSLGIDTSFKTATQQFMDLDWFDRYKSYLDKDKPDEMAESDYLDSQLNVEEME